MIIYTVTRYIFLSNKYVEQNHRHYSSYDKAKAHINEYLEELKQDEKINILHENEDKDKGKYSIAYSWEDYWNTTNAERWNITTDYVY